MNPCNMNLLNNKKKNPNKFKMIKKNYDLKENFLGTICCCK